MAVTYEPLATTTLGSAAASVTFSSISGSYTDLVLVVNARSSRTAVSTAPINITFNSDTGSNYSNTFLFGNGSTTGSSRGTNANNIYTGDMSSSASSYAGFANLLLSINNYSNTTTYKTTIARCNSANAFAEAVCGLWRSTSAINSITITEGSTNNWVADSTFTLYGIKAE